MALSTSNGLINHKVMVAAERAINIGASVLKLGDRKLESSFSAEDMSGDTVSFSLMDGGEVWNGLDVSLAPIGQATAGIQNYTPKREKLELKVDAMTCGYAMTQSDIDLLAKDTCVADRCVARFVDAINRKGEESLSKVISSAKVFEKSASSPYKFDPDEVSEQFSMAKGLIEASKVVGGLQGIGSNMALRKLDAILASGGQYQHSAELGKAMKGELKEVGGISFTDCGQVGYVTGCTVANGTTATLGGSRTTTDGTFTEYTTITLSANLASADAGKKVYVTLSDVNLVDDIGNDLGEMRVLVGTVGDASNLATITLETPVRGGRLDPFRNAVLPSTLSGLTITSVLSPSKQYFNPLIAFKQGDWKVAVKGLAPMAGKDSLTIPAGFGDKGILPIRGTCDSDFYTSKKLLRWDCMFGFGGSKAISGCAFFIEK